MESDPAERSLVRRRFLAFSSASSPDFARPDCFPFSLFATRACAPNVSQLAGYINEGDLCILLSTGEGLNIHADSGGRNNRIRG